MSTQSKKGKVTNGWEFLASLGKWVVLALGACYLVVLAVFFITAYSVRGKFAFWPGLALEFPRESVRKAQFPLSLNDSLLVEHLVGSYAGHRYPKVSVLPTGSVADSVNRSLFDGAKRSIRVVTVHGASWIQNFDVLPSFKDATRRVEVELLVVDPSGAAFDALIASKDRGFERGAGNQRLEKSTFHERFDLYRKLAADSSVNGSLRVRYYTRWPWIRFSIIDDTRATFVLTPFLKPGRESVVFYSNDPWVLESLKRIYDEFHSSSRELDEEAYERLW